jgi:hypothetical protein
MSNKNDYFYHLKWDFKNIFDNYKGKDGYIIYKPWSAGFNNTRMSFELSMCIAYLSNRTLVLPSNYRLCFMKEEYSNNNFFDITDLGINQISSNNFCNLKQIKESYSSIKDISKVIDFDFSKNVLNFENEDPPNNFLKHRKSVNSSDILTEECVFFNGNLLGSSHQTIYTKLDLEIKKLVAKYVIYNPHIFDIALKFINQLGDRQYYALHVRRKDFIYCYPSSVTTCYSILENIDHIIPKGSNIYISTDEVDKSYFQPLTEKYTLFYYDTLLPNIDLEKNIDVSLTSLVEQLICSRAIKFVGTKTSTMSSYINRIRGYMNDIKDKNYYVITEKFDQNKQGTFIDEINYDTNFIREYKDSWEQLS